MQEQEFSIFISHAAVDEEIARSIKEFIGKMLPTHRVFVSSDPGDLSLGDEWVSKILGALGSTKFVLVLTTERGLGRKWVWFEAGRTWFSGVTLLPCCIGKIRKTDLPAPFSQHLAANIDDPRDVKILFDWLESEFGELTEVPDCEEFARTMGRLDIRAEEKNKILDDPYASQIINDIDRTMKTLLPAQRETIKQFAIYGELTTGGVRLKVQATGANMDQWSVPSHLIALTGWLVSNTGNTPHDDLYQNSYCINPTVRPHLRAYFAKDL